MFQKLKKNKQIISNLFKNCVLKQTSIEIDCLCTFCPKCHFHTLKPFFLHTVFKYYLQQEKKILQFITSYFVFTIYTEMKKKKTY